MPRKRYVFRITKYHRKPWPGSPTGFFDWTKVRHVQSQAAVEKYVSSALGTYGPYTKPYKITVERSAPVLFPLDFPDTAPQSAPDFIVHEYPENDPQSPSFDPKITATNMPF